MKVSLFFKCIELNLYQYDNAIYTILPSWCLLDFLILKSGWKCRTKEDYTSTDLCQWYEHKVSG